MRFPPQHPPLRRGEVVQPHETVDVIHGDVRTMVRVRMQIMHGANYNDPQPFSMPSYGFMKTR